VPTDYEGSGITSTCDPGTWSEWRKKNFTFYKRELERFGDETAILDLGIGPGQFGELVQRFRTVIGVDFRAFDPVHVVSNLTKPLPFKTGSFDVVLVSNTFEHLPNTEEVLAEVIRVLKHGGTLLATIPFIMRLHQKPYDFNRYTHYKWAWLCERAGFAEVTVTALSETVDVYRTIQRQFYAYVISANRARSGPTALVRTTLARVLWKIDQLKLAFFAFLYNLPEVTEDFTEGYAVVARKK